MKQTKQQIEQDFLSKISKKDTPALWRLEMRKVEYNNTKRLHNWDRLTELNDEEGLNYSQYEVRSKGNRAILVGGVA